MDILALGSNGKNVGSTWSYESTPGNTEYHERDFVLIETNEGYVGAKKFVLGLESRQRRVGFGPDKMLGGLGRNRGIGRRG